MGESEAIGPQKPALYTVDVPEPMQEPFLRAQEYVARFFRERVEDPAHSTISISGERYILVRAAAMSVEFFDLVTSLYADRGPQDAAWWLPTCYSIWLTPSDAATPRLSTNA